LQKILVIFTGGTIGSLKKKQSIDVDAATAYELIQMYSLLTPNAGVEFETIQPLNMLSENLVPADWTTLITELKQIDYTVYQGIIITHGTDTLPFTAAALSLSCRAIPLPIVLIASNYPLNDSRGKGVANFSHAVDFIREQPSLSGVFVIFENNRGEAIVHLGTRLTQSDPFTDEYNSTYSVPFGEMNNQKFIHNSHVLNPQLTSFHIPHELKTVNWLAQFSNEILYIKPHPGLNYRYYDFSTHKPQAVLHDLYHSGTASVRNSASFASSFIEFLTYCGVHSVPVYIAPLKNQFVALYVSSIQFIEAGAIPLGNISTETALVKLMVAYGSFVEHAEILEFMQKSCIFFEVH